MADYGQRLRGPVAPGGSPASTRAPRASLPRWPCVLAAAAVFAAWPALAGNIVLTGHDDDYHSGQGSSAAAGQLAAMVAFARAGSPDPKLRVLVFDHGTELFDALARLAIPEVRVDPDAGPPDAKLFDAAQFSAIGVASDSSCGGCDNDAAGSTNLQAVKARFARFVNAGGGIFALAGADNAAYYNFLPATVSARGHPDDTGFKLAPADGEPSIPAVNNDATHNFFSSPGQNGESALFEVVETYSGVDQSTRLSVTDVPATLAIRNARIGATGFVGPRPTGVSGAGAGRAGSVEGLMEATTVVVTFGLLAFLVERLTNGLAVVLGYWRWWRTHMEVVSGADPVAQAAIARNRRVALFTFSALMAIGGAFAAKLDLLAQLGAAGTPAVAGYIVTGLMVAAGADPIREALKLRGDRADRNPPAPIQVAGTLVVQREPGSQPEAHG
jgi:hypothetical protein